jgi:hypothetical protein
MPGQSIELPKSGFALEIDGRLKTEFSTKEGAEHGAIELKRRFPMLQIRIYDAAAQSRHDTRSNSTRAYKSSRMPLKVGCRSLPLADRARYSTSARSDGFTQTAWGFLIFRLERHLPSTPSPSIRAGIWRCAMPRAPRQLASTAKQGNPNVNRRSNLGLTQSR